MKRILVLLGVMALVMTLTTPTFAITRGGELDGEDHPWVGLMVADDADGNPLWRCSGTLISPTVFVTAGHCTEAPAATATIWFDTDLEPDPAGNYGYPFEGPTSYEGTVYTHPQYNPDAFYLFDLGLVVLDEPAIRPGYAHLPMVGLVDSMMEGREQAGVDVVGYGLQRVRSNPAGPDFTLADKTRYQARVFIVNTQGAAGVGPIDGTHSMVLSGDAKHGGTCFGDSGGPTFFRGRRTLLAVTSFGLNGNCGGIGGVFRLDHPDARKWIRSFL